MNRPRRLYRKAIAIDTTAPRVASPNLPARMLALAALLDGRRASDEADTLRSNAIAMLQHDLNQQNPAVAEARATLAPGVRRSGRDTEARALPTNCVALRIQASDAADQHLTGCLQSLASMDAAEGRLEQAEWEFRQVSAILRLHAPCNAAALAPILIFEAEAAYSIGQFNAALAAADAARAALPSDAPKLAPLRVALLRAKAMERIGDHNAALQAAGEAVVALGARRDAAATRMRIDAAAVVSWLEIRGDRPQIARRAWVDAAAVAPKWAQADIARGLAATLAATGAPAEALTALDTAAAAGPASPAQRVSDIAVGVSLMIRLGRFDVAARMASGIDAATSPLHAITRTALQGDIASVTGDNAAALVHRQHLLHLSELRYGTDSPALAAPLLSLAEAQLRTRQPEEAAGSLARIEGLGTISPGARIALLVLRAQLMSGAGQSEAALPLLRQAMSEAERQFGPGRATASAQSALGVAELLAHLPEPAVADLEAALAGFEGSSGSQSLDVAHASGALARALEQTGQIARATTLRDRANAIMGRTVTDQSRRQDAL